MMYYRYPADMFKSETDFVDYDLHTMMLIEFDMLRLATYRYTIDRHIEHLKTKDVLFTYKDRDQWSRYLNQLFHARLRVSRGLTFTTNFYTWHTTCRHMKKTVKDRHPWIIETFHKNGLFVSGISERI